MHADHSIGDWLEEAVPIALILIVWNLLAAIIPWAGLSSGLRWTGISIAGLYIVVRGLAHAEHLDPPAWGSLGDVLGNTGQVVMAAGVWFVAAFVVYVVQAVWQAILRFANVQLPGPLISPFDWLGSALAATGLGVALIILIAAAVATHREGPSPDDGFELTGGSDEEAETVEDGSTDDEDSSDEASGDDGAAGEEEGADAEDASGEDDAVDESNEDE